MAKNHRLQNGVLRYKSHLNKPITLEFFQRDFEIFHSIIHGRLKKDDVRYSENFNSLIRIRDICLNL